MSFLGVKDKEELISRAVRQANKAPLEYKKSVELYYITRYFVSVFEARNHALPIQVWNEYRNALDHFFRYITDDNFTLVNDVPAQDSIPKHDQLIKMDGHLTRAALDVIKLTCHASDTIIQKTIEESDENVLSFVDNGSFIVTIKSKLSAARKVFLLAKTEDFDYGQDVRKNKQIVSRYLDAAFSFEEVRDLLDEKTGDIENAKQKLNVISTETENNTRKKSFAPSVAASLVASLIFSAITAFIAYQLGSSSEKPSQEVIQEKEPSFFAPLTNSESSDSDNINKVTE